MGICQPNPIGLDRRHPAMGSIQISDLQQFNKSNFCPNRKHFASHTMPSEKLTPLWPVARILSQPEAVPISPWGIWGQGVHLSLVHRKICWSVARATRVLLGYCPHLATGLSPLVNAVNAECGGLFSVEQLCMSSRKQIYLKTIYNHGVRLLQIKLTHNWQIS
jgi:hypothetical protein